MIHLGLIQQASSGRSTKWTQSHPNNNKKNQNWKEINCKIVCVRACAPVLIATSKHELLL
jgi:hypothetical protein